MAGNTPRHRRVWKNALHTEGSKPSLRISNPIVRLPECGYPHCSACKDTEISASLNEETSICLSATSPPSLRIPSKASKKHRHRLSDMKKSPRTAQWLPAGINHLFMSGKRDSNPRPSAWEADALPTELLPRSECKYTKSAELSSSFGQFLFSPSDIDDKRTGASVLYRKTGYEKEYNGGMGSNGLTSARHDVFSKYLAEKYPESYDKAVPEELVYSGNLKLTDKVEDSPLDAGKLVLSPTRTYAPVVKKLLDALRPEIHGMVHCSGGAQTKILHFVDKVRVVKDNLFPVPPLFKTIKEQSGTDWEEMYKVFNMGHRLEVYLSPEHAEEVIAISKSFNIDAQIVGRVEESDKKELIIRSEFGEFKY